MKMNEENNPKVLSAKKLWNECSRHRQMVIESAFEEGDSSIRTIRNGL